MQVEEIDDVSILHITGVTRGDSGQIRCTAFLREDLSPEQSPCDGRTASTSRLREDCASSSCSTPRALLGTGAAPQSVTSLGAQDHDGREEVQGGPQVISCDAELTVVQDVSTVESDCSIDLLGDPVASDCGEPMRASVGLRSDETMTGGGGEPREPAMIVKGPQDITALVGDRVLLKAVYMGQPEPEVKWSRAVSFPV